MTASEIWVEASPRLLPFGVFQVITKALKENKIYHKKIFTNADGNIVIVPNPVHQYDDNYWHKMEAKREESIRNHVKLRIKQGVSLESAIGDTASVFFVTNEYIKNIVQDIIEVVA